MYSLLFSKLNNLSSSYYSSQIFLNILLYPSLYLSSNLSKLVCAKGWTIVYISFLLTFSSGLIYQEDCSKGALREWEKNATRWPDYLKKHPPLERPIRKGSL